MDTGRFYEILAIAYMRIQGYSLIAQRWKKCGAECDLIMSRGEVIVFVEVKYRKGSSDSLEAWTVRQRLNMARVLELWAPDHPDKEFRVDYICFWQWGMSHVNLDWRDFVR